MDSILYFFNGGGSFQKNISKNLQMEIVYLNMNVFLTMQNFYSSWCQKNSFKNVIQSVFVRAYFTIFQSRFTFAAKIGQKRDT